MDAPALGLVGNAETSYTRFAYSYARSAEEAYAKEWRNYDSTARIRKEGERRTP